MRTWATLAGGAVLFALAATANAGGYRYGVSDQAFYIPVIAQTLDPALFPRDTAVFGPQARLWPGRQVFAGLSRTLSFDLPVLFGLTYLLTLVTLFGAAIGLARGLGLGWWATTAFLALLTLRHQIAKTGANSLEGYMHPRMLAFAAGLAALAFLVRRRALAAALCVAAAAVVHPTTAIWFGAVLGVAFTASLTGRGRTAASVGLVLTGMAVGTAVVLLKPGPVLMDAAWRDVVQDRTYLFAAQWPASAWLLNLAYPLAIGAIYRRRRATGVTVPGEGPLFAGLLVLVAGFLVTVPLAAMGVAAVVQLQTPRVFWVLDAVTAAYVAWWLLDSVAARHGVAIRAALIAALALASASRGFYVLRVETERPIASLALAATEWTDVMAWLRTQPASWHVLADPGHAWLFGSSVRVSARRDTMLEASKDTAMALYDRGVALRVAERTAALEHGITADRLGALDDRYQLDVLVTDDATPFDRPILYRNARFVVYDLR